MARELGRILISVILLAIATYLFYEGCKSPSREMAVALTDVASGIITGNLVYWLAPAAPPAAKAPQLNESKRE